MNLGGTDTINPFLSVVITDAGLKRVHRKNQPKQKPVIKIPTFTACDGEGGTVGDESAYYLLRVGASVLYPGEGRRITTIEAFNFLHECAETYHGTKLVGFFFDYDISNILRDVPRSILASLANRAARTRYITKKDRNGKPVLDRNGNPSVKDVTAGVIWRGWRFDHIPRKFFTLERIGPDHKVIGKRFKIEDTFGFFNTSFLKALKQWGIGAEYWDMIERNKNERVNMTGIYSDEELEYNRIECVLLEQLMSAIAIECANVDIRPTYWTGAGALAQAALKRYKAPTYVEIPDAVREAAQYAFHAGRFENGVTGPIVRPVHEFDKASAYAWAITLLPCLGIRSKGEWYPHGQWVYRDTIPETGYYLCHVRWYFNNQWRSYSKDNRSQYGPLPVRRRDGSIYYPRNGEGWYWSPEIRTALKTETGQRKVTHAYTFDVLGCWQWVQQCTCPDPFLWVREIYEERKRIGKGGKGIVLKLMLSSLYGKFAQSVGKAAYGNPVYAGLITSLVRAQMMEIVNSGVQVVMIATDGIYTLDIPPGIDYVEADTGQAQLGQWEHLELPDMFIAKPGHYWSSSEKVKTRGISFKSFQPFITGYLYGGRDGSQCDRRDCNNEPHTHVERYADVFARDGWEARVTVSYHTFVGYRLAVHRNDPGVFCQWVKETAYSSSRSTIRGKAPKRAWYKATLDDAYVTEPLSGLPITMSARYSKEIGLDPFSVSEMVEGPDYARGFGDQ
jgi:hypothetical protein